MSPAPYLVLGTLVSTAGFPTDQSPLGTASSFGTEGDREVTFVFSKEVILCITAVSSGAYCSDTPVTGQPSALDKREVASWYVGGSNNTGYFCSSS